MGPYDIVARVRSSDQSKLGFICHESVGPVVVPVHTSKRNTLALLRCSDLLLPGSMKSLQLPADKRSSYCVFRSIDAFPAQPSASFSQGALPFESDMLHNLSLHCGGEFAFPSRVSLILFIPSRNESSLPPLGSSLGATDICGNH